MTCLTHFPLSFLSFFSFDLPPPEVSNFTASGNTKRPFWDWHWKWQWERKIQRRQGEDRTASDPPITFLKISVCVTDSPSQCVFLYCCLSLTFHLSCWQSHFMFVCHQSTDMFPCRESLCWQVNQMFPTTAWTVCKLKSDIFNSRCKVCCHGLCCHLKCTHNTTVSPIYINLQQGKHS